MENCRVRAAAFWMCALVLATTLAARAADPGGVTGYVIDLSGKPLADMRVDITSDGVKHEVRTDRHGFFADITLQPGYYSFFVDAECASHGDLAMPCGSEQCAVATVLDGERTRVTLVAVRTGWLYADCYYSRYSPGTVDPNQTASLYRI